MILQEKLCGFIEGIEDVVDYCCLTLLETCLSEKKDELTRDTLVKTLRLTGHRNLARSVSHDSNFVLTINYLYKKLRPLKYEYRAFGLLAGLDLPDHQYLTEHLKRPCDFYFTVVLLQWLQRHNGNTPSKKLLKQALHRVQEEEMADHLLWKYRGMKSNQNKKYLS